VCPQRFKRHCTTDQSSEGQVGTTQARSSCHSQENHVTETEEADFADGWLSTSTSSSFARTNNCPTCQQIPWENLGLMMEYAKKMALVEPRLLDGMQWQQQQLQNPMGKAMSSLDGDMQEVLTRPTISPGEKVKLYHQVLQRYMNYKDQREMAAEAPVRVSMVDTSPSPLVSDGSSSSTVPMTLPPTPSDTPAGAIERELLDSVPMHMKKKAQLLVNRIKANPQLAWTDTGELVYKDQVIANTNVSDLVNDALRRRKHFEPSGWQIFAQAMKETNVPQDLIGHRERWQWMQRRPQQGAAAAAAATAAASHLAPLKKKRIVSTRVPRWSSYYYDRTPALISFDMAKKK
jgi:hypothetical protein